VSTCVFLPLYYPWDMLSRKLVHRNVDARVVHLGMEEIP